MKYLKKRKKEKKIFLHLLQHDTQKEKKRKISKSEVDAFHKASEFIAPRLHFIPQGRISWFQMTKTVHVFDCCVRS